VNLIHNALKFTSEGGAVLVRAVFEDGSVIVRVTDTGAGIAAEDLPRIFERFYKADRARSSAGTGLGLAIVKHTVEAHGGSVAVESAEGRGATFSFSLPAASLALPA
jgi:two-component system phosphate regulon sensor histidine kinase PhoR